MNRREFGFGLAAATGTLVLTKPFTTARGSAPLRVNGARLNQHLKELSEFGKNPQGGVSRVAYSEADRQGREYVMGLMRAAKLDTSIDAAGNLVIADSGNHRIRMVTTEGIMPLISAARPINRAWKLSALSFHAR